MEHSVKEVRRLSEEAISGLSSIACEKGGAGRNEFMEILVDDLITRKNKRRHIMLLDQIQKANDIKNINPKDYPALASEIRDFLVRKISVTGGHLGSNLGAVELTMALHLSLNLPDDKIIWDVGHQSYTHKILTGRKEGFDELRKFGGLSGFPKRSESSCDAYDTGHSSTSISAGVGYVSARDLKKEDYRVVSVIGDGALTGGLAYEALNNAAQLKKNFIIVLNDNKMSISHNVGALAGYLSHLRTTNGYFTAKENVSSFLNGVPVIGAPIKALFRTAKKRSAGPCAIPRCSRIWVFTILASSTATTSRNWSAFSRPFVLTARPTLLHVVTKKGAGLCAC